MNDDLQLIGMENILIDKNTSSLKELADETYSDLLVYVAMKAMKKTYKQVIKARSELIISLKNQLKKIPDIIKELENENMDDLRIDDANTKAKERKKSSNANI